MQHITMFLFEFLWVSFFLGLFSLLGGFVILPFREKIFSPLLAAPLTGILITALGIAGLYSVVAFPFWLAATLTIITFSIFTIISLIIIKPWPFKINYSLSIFVLCVILLLTYLINYTSIYFGHHGFLFMNGTDQLGYVQVADWIRLHMVNNPPIASPSVPYQSWANLCFQNDPRFGTYYLLAFISWIQQQSGMFTYDNASSIILVAGILGVSAVYSRSAKTFILLTIGLIISYWFDLSRSGYLGKIVDYPAVIFLVGLYLRSANKKIESSTVALLAVLTCAVSTCYPGTVTALMLALIIGVYMLTDIIFSKEKYFFEKLYKQRDIFYCTVLSIVIAVATTGGLSRPFAIGFGGLNETWASLWQQLFESSELHHAKILIWYSHTASIITLVLSAVFFITALFISVKRRNVIAITILFSPLILLFIMWILNAIWSVYEFTGIFFPLILTGFVYLSDNLFFENHKRAKLFFYLVSFFIAIHIPQFIQTADHFTRSSVRSLQFSEPKMNVLAKKMNGHHIIINIHDVTHALPILIDFGYRPMHLEWTPKAWKSIMGYRPWSAPTIKKSHYYLVLRSDPVPLTCRVINKTNQYQLLFC
ncbi:MAG TPA: hypothetical protein VJK30_01070 [Coxiellaceae bacterium]|nr:hypothetical protein [Coxiellaceae bacterium]